MADRGRGSGRGRGNSKGRGKGRSKGKGRGRGAPSITRQDTEPATAEPGLFSAIGSAIANTFSWADAVEEEVGPATEQTQQKPDETRKMPPTPEPPIPRIMRGTLPPAQPIPPDVVDYKVGIMNYEFPLINQESLKTIFKHKESMEHSINCITATGDWMQKDEPIEGVTWPNPLFIDNQVIIAEGLIRTDKKFGAISSVMALNNKFKDAIISSKRKVVLNPDCVSWEIILQSIVNQYIKFPRIVDKVLELINISRGGLQGVGELLSELDKIKLKLSTEKQFSTRLFKNNISFVNAFLLTYLLNERCKLSKPLTVYMVIDNEDIDQELPEDDIRTIKENIGQLSELSKKIFLDNVNDEDFEEVIKLTEWERSTPLIKNQDLKSAVRWATNIVDAKLDKIFNKNYRGEKKMNAIINDKEFKQFIKLHGMINNHIASLSRDKKGRYLDELTEKGDEYKSTSFWIANLSRRNAEFECKVQHPDCDLDNCYVVEIELPANASALCMMSNDGGKVLISPCTLFRTVIANEKYIKLRYVKSSTGKADPNMFQKMLKMMLINSTPLKISKNDFAKRGDYALIDSNDYHLMKKYMTCS